MHFSKIDHPEFSKATMVWLTRKHKTYRRAKTLLLWLYTYFFCNNITGQRTDSWSRKALVDQLLPYLQISFSTFVYCRVDCLHNIEMIQVQISLSVLIPCLSAFTIVRLSRHDLSSITW